MAGMISRIYSSSGIPKFEDWIGCRKLAPRPPSLHPEDPRRLDPLVVAESLSLLLFTQCPCPSSEPMDNMRLLVEIETLLHDPLVNQHSYGKSQSWIGKSTINGPFSTANCQITRGYVHFRTSRSPRRTLWQIRLLPWIVNECFCRLGYFWNRSWGKELWLQISLWKQTQLSFLQ